MKKEKAILRDWMFNIKYKPEYISENVKKEKSILRDWMFNIKYKPEYISVAK